MPPPNRQAPPPAPPVVPPPPVGALHRLESDYYRRMKLQRVYALRLRVEKAPSMTGSQHTPSPPEGAMVFRPIIAGALVTPTEVALPLQGPFPEVVFHVTPMALGELPDTRVDYVLPGQPVHTLTLPMRGVSQTWTLRWLFLFLILPMVFFVIRGAKHWATTPEGATGTVDRVRLIVPEWIPFREAIATTGQEFVDFLVLRGGAVRASFISLIVFGLLTLLSFVRNLVGRASKSSDGFSLYPSGQVGSNPRTLPSFLEKVEPKPSNH